jgi:hypothetical protein
MEAPRGRLKELQLHRWTDQIRQDIIHSVYHTFESRQTATVCVASIIMCELLIICGELCARPTSSTISRISNAMFSKISAILFSFFVDTKILVR